MSAPAVSTHVSTREATELLKRIAAGADKPTLLGRRWADVLEGTIHFRMACGARIKLHKSNSEIAYVDFVCMPGGRRATYEEWVDAEGGANPIDALDPEQLRAIVAALRSAPVESHP